MIVRFVLGAEKSPRRTILLQPTVLSIHRVPE